MARLLNTFDEQTGLDLTVTNTDVTGGGWSNTTGRDIMVFATVRLSSLATSAATFTAGLSVGATVYASVPVDKTNPGGALAYLMVGPILVLNGQSSTKLRVFSTNAGDTSVTSEVVYYDWSIASDVEKVGGEDPISRSEINTGGRY